MKSWSKSAVAIFVAFALACGGLTDSELEVPEKGATETEAEALTPSVLNIPMTITYAALRESVEDGLPEPLYEDKGYELAGRIEMDTTIKQNGEARVSSRGDALIVEVPAKVKVRVYRRKRSGEEGSTLGTGTAKLTVRVSMTPQIQDDWSMIGNTEITWRWNDTPSMTIASIDIELDDRLDDKISETMEEAEDDIDKELLEESPLRESVAAVWSDLAAAQKLKRNPPVWVRFTPEALFSTDPEMTGTGMAVTIGAKGVLEASLSQKMADVEVGELADRQPPTSESGARLHVPVKLGWSSLKTTLSNQLEGLVFEASGASATLTELIDLYPSGDKVALGLRLAVETPAGSTDVEAWVTGRMDVNTAGETLSIADFSYDAATGNAALDAAHDLLRDEITERVKELLTVPISDEIASVETTFTEILAGVELSEGVVMSGTVSTVRMKGVRLSDTHLILDTSVVCDLSLSVTATGD